MSDSNRELANRIRRMVAAPALPAEAKEPLAEYQRRADTVNKRLNTASEWLRRGLLSEAIDLIEQFPDALEAAKDLELGRTAADTLRDRCRAQLIDPPAGLDMKVAWEINAAYVAREATEGPLGRYRAACLRGDSAKHRLACLSEACAAVASTRSELGTACESIERSMTQQARELLVQRISELARLADKQSGIEGSHDSTKSPSVPEKANSAFSEEYKELLSVIQSLNDSKAELKLDYGNHSALRELATRQDEIELGGLLVQFRKDKLAFDQHKASDDLDEEHLQKLIDTLKARLRRIDDVLLRVGKKIADARVGNKREPVPPAVQSEFEDAQRIVRETDDQQNDVKRAQKQLREQLEIDTGSAAELKSLYEHASRGGLTIPDDLNLLYQTKLAQINREARSRRNLMFVRSGAVVLSLTIVAGTVGLVLFGLNDKPRGEDHTEIIQIASKNLDEGRFEVAEESLNGKDVSTSDDGNKVLQRLGSARDKYKEYEAALNALVKDAPTDWSIGGEPAFELRKGIGRLPRDLETANRLVTLTSRPVAPQVSKAKPSTSQDGVWLGLNREAFAKRVYDKVASNRQAVEALEAKIRMQSAELTEAVAAVKREEDSKGPKWLLDEYDKQIAAWLAVASVTNKDELKDKVSDETYGALIQPFEKLKDGRDELASRVLLMQAAADPTQTFSQFIELQINFADTPTLLRSPTLAQTLRDAKRDQELLRSVASAIDAFADGSIQAGTKETVNARAAACQDKLAPIFVGVRADDRADLGQYYAAYATVLNGNNTLGLDVIREDFLRDLWRQLGSKRNVDGAAIYSLDGAFSPAGETGWYYLSRRVNTSREFDASAGSKLLINLGPNAPLKLENLGLGTLASEALAIIDSVKEDRIEPLSAGLIIAQRVIASNMPSPLKRRTLDKLLTPYRTFTWPGSVHVVKVAENVRNAGEHLSDNAPWTHETATSNARDAQISFERSLSNVPNLETVAIESHVRVKAAAEAMSAARFFGMAWVSAPNGVIRKETLVHGGPHTLLVVTMNAGRIETREVGSVSDSGTISLKTVLADGTPLIARRLTKK